MSWASRQNSRVTYKGKKIRLASDFVTVTSKVRQQWHHIFKKLKKRKHELRIFYPASCPLSIKILEKHLKMQELKEYCTHQSYLKNLLELVVCLGWQKWSSPDADHKELHDLEII